MDPVTISAMINIAVSVTSLFSKKGPSIADLMAIQTQLLQRISTQLLVIQRGIELIIDRLDEVQQSIDQIPENVASEVYRRKLEGLLGTYRELVDGYIRERDANGVQSAHKVFDNRFEEELLQPIRDVRNTLFTFKDPLHIPLISTTLQAEVHGMILLNYPSSVIIPALNRYAFWLSDLLSETIENSIPFRLKKFRETNAKLFSEEKNIPITDICRAKTDTAQGAMGEASYRFTHTLDYSTFGFDHQITLNEDQLADLNPLLNAGILTMTDLPQRLHIINVTDTEFTVLVFIPGGVHSSRPDILAAKDAIDAIRRTRQCNAGSIRQPVIQISQELSQRIEAIGFGIVSLGCLQFAGIETLNAVTNFLSQLSAVSQPVSAFAGLMNFNENLVGLAHTDRPAFINFNRRSAAFKTTEPPSLKLGDEVDAAAKTLDLAELPLGPQLLQLAAIAFRDAAIESRAIQEFTELQARISESITNPNMGFLLQVSIFTNEFGNILIPSGQLLYPMGVGIEPLDAYAEYLRKPQLRPGGEVPGGLINNTFFVWVTKSGTELQAKTVPPQFRNFFIQEATTEATRRNRLAGWIQVLPLDPFESIIRARFWTDVERNRAKLIADETKRLEVTTLSNHMRLLEIEVNNLYRQYQEVQSEIAHHQKLTTALNTISTLSGIMQSSIHVGKLFCTTDQSSVGGSELKAADDVPASLEVFNQIIINRGEHRQELRRSLKMEFQQMQDLDAALEGLYKQGGVSIPDRQIFIPPVLD